MCGIVGILKFVDDKINKQELEIFTSSLHHRGPDGRGIYLNESKKLGLGHTRTAIFDISKAGHQPMSYLEERYWITFNGEIYNFIELRNELKCLGYKFISNSDTEVILAAYSQWGEKCQFKFNGDWAFAIWDNKEKKLFLSCDRFGTKPLYYLHQKNYFIFASELKAFMSLPSNFIPSFDHGFFLWLGKNHGCLNTFLKNVFLLPGGSQINVGYNNLFTLKKWWKTIENLVDVPKNYDDQVANYKELFFDACKIRMRSDVPIASCLSGGIDSSSIASTISEIRKKSQNIERYSEITQNVFICEYKGDQKSEKHFAEEVILNKDIKPTFVEINSENLKPEDIVKSFFNHEWIDSDSVNLLSLYGIIRKSGIRVSIDGNTPDETLGGYWNAPLIAMKDVVWPWSQDGRFEDLVSIWKSIDSTHNQMTKTKVIAQMFSNQKIYNSFKSFIKLLLISSNNRLTNNFLSKSLIEKTKRWKNEMKVLKKDFSSNKNRYDLLNKSELLLPQQDNISGLDHFNSYLYKEFHYLTTPYLLHKYDKLSMAHGVLSRAPFLDPRLITYTFSLPSSAKIGEGYTKKILRDSMKNIVPDKILERKDKRGFSSPNKWYDKNLKQFISDTISSTNFLESNIFNGKLIKKDYENSNVQQHGYSGKVILRYIGINSIINSFNNIALKKTH